LPRTKPPRFRRNHVSAADSDSFFIPLLEQLLGFQPMMELSIADHDPAVFRDGGVRNGGVVTAHSRRRYRQHPGRGVFILASSFWLLRRGIWDDGSFI